MLTIKATPLAPAPKQNKIIVNFTESKRFHHRNFDDLVIFIMSFYIDNSPEIIWLSCRADNEISGRKTA